MQILKMHNLTQNYRINLAARGILQSHGTLRHMTVESNNGIRRYRSLFLPALLSPENMRGSRGCKMGSSMSGE